MSSDDSDAQEDYGPFPELTKRVIRWAEVIGNDSKRKSLENVGKVYFYSPIIFGKSYFTGYWSEAVTDRLITNMRCELTLVSDNFLTQMDRLERTYTTVCGTLKEYCDEHRKDEVASLLHFTNHCEHEDSIELIMEEASSAPLFESIRCNLDKSETSKMILLLCLKYYFYIVDMVVVKRKDPEKALTDHNKKTLKKIDELKVKGNALFQSNRYRKAIKYYSEAIKIDCYNPVLYGNRAQANLYLNENWEALLDAKRAILLNPSWPKAYYRFSQALFDLGYTERAIEENRRGQRICRQDDHDIKDLQSQLNRMLAEKERIRYMEKNGPSHPPPLDDLNYLDDNDSGSDAEDKVCREPILGDTYIEAFDSFGRVRVDTPATRKEVGLEALLRQQAREKREREKREKEEEVQRAKERKKELKKQQEKRIRQTKEEERKRQQQEEDDRKREEENQMKQLSKRERKKKLAEDRDFYLEKASMALLEGRARQAYEGYLKAEEVMKESTGKYGSLTEGGRVIFLYACGMAALETASPQLFPVALEKFEVILTQHHTIRTALPYYGKAKTLFHMHKFQEAIAPIDDGCSIAERFPSSVETWPGTSVNIPQTESPTKMINSLKDLRDQCLNPPPPDAICRNSECESVSIYFNDIDFIGFVKVCCSDHCRMDFHIECWRKLRISAKKKTDKDMLDGECCTPDCSGLIRDVATYGEDALVKSRVTKKEAPHEKIKTMKPVSPVLVRDIATYGEDALIKSCVTKKEAPVKTVKPVGKQMKKEKKARKVKSKERVHKEGHYQDHESHQDENTAEDPHPVEVASVNSDPVVEPVKAEPSIPEPAPEPTHFQDITDTAMLHQEPAYIIKKESPELVEEKKPPSKSAKSKNKKKKEVITLEHRFYDQDNRNLMTAEDAPLELPDHLFLGYQNGATNRNSWSVELPRFDIILTEEEKSLVLGLQMHFLQILETHGPLKIGDQILVEEVKTFPIDSQELITRHGGLAPFLCLSEGIAMEENYVCRLCDLSRCRDIIAHQKVVWTPLPQPGAPPAAHRQYLRGGIQSPWAGLQYNSYNQKGSLQHEPEKKMDTLDTFEYSDSDGTVETSDAESGSGEGSSGSEDELSPPETQSGGDETSSPPWTPSREDGVQDTVITTDFDGELDKLISAEHLFVGDAFSGTAVLQGSEGDKPSIPVLERYVVSNEGDNGFNTVRCSDQHDEVDGDLKTIEDAVSGKSKVCDGFDEKPSQGAATENSSSFVSDISMSEPQVHVNVVDWSDGPRKVVKTDSEDISISPKGTDNGTSAHGQTVSGVTSAGYKQATNNGQTNSASNSATLETRNLDIPDTTIDSQSSTTSERDFVSCASDGIEEAESGYVKERPVSNVRKASEETTSIDSGSEILDAKPSTLEKLGTLDKEQSATLDAETLTLDVQNAEQGVKSNTLDGISNALGKHSADLDDQLSDLDQNSQNADINEKLVSQDGNLPSIDSASSVCSGGEEQVIANALNIRSSLEKLNQGDVVMRCSSADVVSSDSSGISLSPILSVNLAALQDKLSRYIGNIRTLLNLNPEMEDVVGDDEVVMNLLTDKFYKYVNELKESSVKPEQKSVGTAASVNVLTKSSNTDPLRTYEKEYHQAERKCENLEIALRDAFTKYQALENVLAVARAESFKNKTIIEDLQRNMHTADEKSSAEISGLQQEKSALLRMIHDLEAKSRATQSTLQEYEAAKEVLTKTKLERDELNKTKTDLEKRVEELEAECQRQKQRANKSEVSIVQIHKEQALKPLSEAIKECNFHVGNLNQVLAREPNANLTLILKDWERCLEENKQKLETTVNQFDSQIQQLHSGKVLTDLPVIPRPEPSRSKSLKNKPGPPWPHFAGPPPPFPQRLPMFNVPPLPFRPPTTMHLPPRGPPNVPPPQGGPPPNGMPPQGVPPQGEPKSTSPPSVTPTSTPPPTSASPLPPAVAHLPAARGMSNAPPAGPGATMPLAPGPGEAIPAGGRQYLPQQPIGTRSNGANGGVMTNGAMKRETDSPGTESAQAKVFVPAAKPRAPHGGPTAPQGHGAHVKAGAHHAPVGHQSPLTVEQRAAGAGSRSSYQRLMDRLGSKYPAYNKIQLTNFLKIVRVNNGNSLSGLSMDGITQRVGELVAEAQAKIPHKPFLDNQGISRVTPLTKIPAAPSQNPWSSVDDTSTPGTNWSNELYNDEVDPCVICHEEMALKEVLDLECGHRFHADCIQEWLGTKSTCPNCRKFTKLKQDFPPLM